MCYILVKKLLDLPLVVILLLVEWTLRKTNVPGITTPLIESLVSIGMKKGARASKACGAGGGGCFILLVDPDAQAKVRALIEAKGGCVLPVKVGRQGLRVLES